MHNIFESIISLKLIYLPEISYPEQQDIVSAKGFIYGYSGSVLLLVFSLLLIQRPDLFGIHDPTLAPRLTFVFVGLWWIGFAQVTYRRLPNNIFKKKPDNNYVWKGFVELKLVLKSLSKLTKLKKVSDSLSLFKAGVPSFLVFFNNSLKLFLNVFKST